MEDRLDYKQFVKALAKPGEDILKTMTPEKAEMLHMAVGLSGEAGELLDCVKKHVIYDKPLDKENYVEELSDILFYFTGLLINQGIELDWVTDANVAKLKKRYHKGTYSNEQATERADKNES